MGCEVVSVYNDEVIGKIGFTQTLIDDLIDRDYRQLQPLPNHKELTKKIKFIYGFTQSFVISKLFFTMIKEQECLAFVAGRFIVVEEIKTQKQRVIVNSEFISAFVVYEKMCLVGLVGGTILLWDLQFQEVKLQILLPQTSTIVSTLGLTSKYIFATDSSTPNNFVFCYDLRTAKLLSYKPISSFQPSVKSICIGEDLYVTACADGIWIIRMRKSQKQLEITKGMFGRYPKTSMLCLSRVGDYLISGGVDGYLYVWKISSYKCCRALKVSDSEIISIGVKQKYVILGCMNGRVKVYTFQVKKKQKKEYAIPQLQNDEEDEDVAFIVVDSYLKEGPTIAVASSINDPLLYYAQTKEGVLYQKWLPTPTTERKKVNIRSDINETIRRIHCGGEMLLMESKIYSTYLGNQKALYVDIYSFKQQEIILDQQRVVLVTQECQHFLTYSSSTEQLAFITKSNKLQVSLTKLKYGSAVAQQSISDLGTTHASLLQLQHEEVLSLNYISANHHQMLCVTTNSSVFVYQRLSRLIYEEKYHTKYQKKVPSHIKTDTFALLYDQDSKKWRNQNEKNKILSPEDIQHYSLVHTAKLKSIQDFWSKQKLSCGGGFFILWK